MPNRNYLNGKARELRIINSLKADGWLAVRSAGSKGDIDIVGINPQEHIVTLIQVKPKSMSRKAKERIEAQLKQFEGDYKLKVKCISLYAELEEPNA